MRPPDELLQEFEDQLSPFASPKAADPVGRRPGFATSDSPFAATELGDEAEAEAWPDELEEEQLEEKQSQEEQLEQEAFEASPCRDFAYEELDESNKDEQELDRDTERASDWESEGFDGEHAEASDFESFAAESLADERSLAEELGEDEFEKTPAKPLGTANRIVIPARVSCANRDRKLPIFKAIGTEDPVGVLEAVCQRAVGMLENALGELNRIRARVRAGEPVSWPVISDLLAWSLENRMLMRLKDPKSWTGKGPRTAEQIIRWLGNIRKTIAGGQLHYTCLAATNCNPTTWAWVFPSRYRVFLCRRFWHPKPGVDAATHLDYQAQTIIHEVSHIYYVTEDSGRGPGHAECISQFVADANGSPIDPDFARFCGTAGPALP